MRWDNSDRVGPATYRHDSYTRRPKWQTQDPSRSSKSSYAARVRSWSIGGRNSGGSDPQLVRQIGQTPVFGDAQHLFEGVDEGLELLT